MRVSVSSIGAENYSNKNASKTISTSFGSEIDGVIALESPGEGLITEYVVIEILRECVLDVDCLASPIGQVGFAAHRRYEMDILLPIAYTWNVLRNGSVSVSAAKETRPNAYKLFDRDVRRTLGRR